MPYLPSAISYLLSLGAFCLALHHTPIVGKGITGKGIPTELQTAALIPLPTGDCELDIWERAAARPYRIGKCGWMWLR